MAATIKPIEAKSVHQIQSGQVIVDLCSVVKELVENALDAHASTIEVRFKNYGLDGIEIQDNGIGISESNYNSIALKHYTSKLSSYDDLSKLQTFGFRGEALSSLCAVSTFTIHTAQAHEAPKGKRLEFEVSGKLKSATIVASPKGTTAIVEDLFARLPVRQKELNKNIKREYGKVLGILHAYACISTLVKFTVKNTSKGKSGVVFSTKGNATVRENIANVYGAKMLSQLIELDLQLDFSSTSTQSGDSDTASSKVTVVGHISKPVFGEGRQTPDRQMFFVNGRPCGLPQIAKIINEVYKSFNVSQSPFVCADLRLDTNSYDVNVSPDKRTIFLHDANALTEGLKTALVDRFDAAEQTVPQSQRVTPKLPSFRPLTVDRSGSLGSDEPDVQETPPSRPPLPNSNSTGDGVHTNQTNDEDEGPSLLKSYFGGIISTREESSAEIGQEKRQEAATKRGEKIAAAVAKRTRGCIDVDEYDDVREQNANRGRRPSSEELETPLVHVRDFNARMHEEITATKFGDKSSDSNRAVLQARPNVSTKGVVTNAFDRMRPRRLSPELATFTIGDKVITRMVGTSDPSISPASKTSHMPKAPLSEFSKSLRKFGSGSTGNNASSHGDGAVQEVLPHRSITEEGSPALALSRSDIVEDREPELQFDPSRANPVRSDINDGLTHDDVPYDEAVERLRERNRVKELIRTAEKSSTTSTSGAKREMRTSRNGLAKSSTVETLAIMNLELDEVRAQTRVLREQRQDLRKQNGLVHEPGLSSATEEDHLSLTISKDDFAQMHIAGQFNLGFIIALRHRRQGVKTKRKDELFIIDQHASDEKFNFEKLQAETVIGNQRLVHPVMLDLTAVEEEIIIENTVALQQNGFIVETDLSGDLPVGQRCQLMSLPLSKETTLGIRDLEELVHLLSETHVTIDSSSIPRPSKIRKMFAMRACRSSIMIGKTLSKRQMRNILEHMGTIDKPWNCPHGRPTMRHLISLDDIYGQLWNEGDGVLSGNTATDCALTADTWAQYLA